MYDEACLNAFLKQQERLFREPVAETIEEADAFERIAGLVYAKIKKK